MAGYTLELPQIQNWSCHNCGGCCTQHGIYITNEEKARIEKQNWTPADGVPADQPLFVKMGGMLGKTWYRLAHQPNGGCVFLDERGLCKIHGKFGEEAKPLACRIYPYAFHPKGNKVTVSLRFSCPSVAENKGPSVQSQRKDLKAIAKQVVPANVTAAPAPKLRPGVQLDWDDTLKIVDALDQTIAADADFPLKLARCLFWMELINQTNFDKIRGDRLSELLELLTAAAEDELAEAIPDLGPVSKIGRTQFRLLAGQYARKDTYTSDTSLAGRWDLFKGALKLTSGSGMLPSLQPCLKEIPFEQLEQPFGGLPEASQEMLSRYFRVKLQGMHFCGAAYYKVPLIEGFQSLVLVYPVIMWISRWLAATADRDQLQHEDVIQALTFVDHHHGYSKALGTWGFRRRVTTLAQSRDLDKLVAWYTR